MPACRTKFNGVVQYDPHQILEVPEGLFGFPEETQFLLLELPSTGPLVLIQSVRSPHLCFLSLPVQIVDPAYTLSLRAQDLAAFGYSESAPPVMGKDVLCLAILILQEHRTATANLAAPLVIEIATHRGIQAIVTREYSARHPLSWDGARIAC